MNKKPPIFFATLRKQRKELYAKREKLNPQVYTYAMIILEKALKKGKGVCENYPPIICVADMLRMDYNLDDKKAFHSRWQKVVDKYPDRLGVIYPRLFWGKGVSA